MATNGDVAHNGSPAELWRHPEPETSQMWKFLEHINSKYKLDLQDYPDLYKWSVENVSEFWEEAWHFVGITASKSFDKVLDSDSPMFPRPDFFAGARLNYAENLLYPAKEKVNDSDTAVITLTENHDVSSSMTWRQLRQEVEACSLALTNAGVRKSDVVAGYISNHAGALVAMLAAASIGAIWTGLSPDTGVSAVLDRLVQIGPKVLFADNGVLYNGKEWSSTEKTVEIVAELQKHGLELVIVLDTLAGSDLGLDALASKGVKAESYSEFIKSGSAGKRPQFEQLPPSHPLFILYSSGTTGLPKPIVHTALGTLIQHKKEHYLHCSMNSSSRQLYYTTTSWMMWAWSVSALACGTTLVLYSGSPFKPHGYMSMPKLLSEHKVTHFGTSASYLTMLETNNISPVDDPTLDLSSLEAIYSTASPLPPSTFSYVYEAFPKQVNLASITGGTDIISLFGAPCPLLPVRVGEIQCAGLGMAISVMDPASDPDAPRRVAPGEEGDLVCARPFPCQPLTFFGAGGDERYRAAYFERFPGLWHHGDFVRMDPRTGGLVMLGRSDGVLKPHGVRFGSAEIYNILTKFFGDEVADAVCVGRRRESESEETVCLFVVMVEGRQFGQDLRERIKATVRKELSPRHVPGIVEECGGGIPKTGNGKKIEVAVKQILSGMKIKTNASVANPEAIEWFREWAKTHA